MFFRCSCSSSIWEIYTIVNRIAGDTISSVLLELRRDQTGIPLFMGTFMRHLWRDDEKTKAAFLAGPEVGVHWPCLDRTD